MDYAYFSHLACVSLVNEESVVIYCASVGDDFTRTSVWINLLCNDPR